MNNYRIYSVVLLASGESAKYLDHIRLGDTRAFPVHCTVKGRFVSVFDPKELAAAAFPTLNRYEWRGLFDFSGPIYVEGRTKWIEHVSRGSALFRAHVDVLQALEKFTIPDHEAEISSSFEGQSYRPHISLDWYFDRRRILVPDGTFSESIKASVSFVGASLFEYLLSGPNPSVIERATHRF